MTLCYMILTLSVPVVGVAAGWDCGGSEVLFKLRSLAVFEAEIFLQGLQPQLRGIAQRQLQLPLGFAMPARGSSNSSSRSSAPDSAARHSIQHECEQAPKSLVRHTKS